MIFIFVKYQLFNSIYVLLKKLIIIIIIIYFF